MYPTMVWDVDTVSDYWLMDPINNIDWYTFAPVPAYCTVQWLKKFSICGGQYPRGVIPFMYRNQNISVMRITLELYEHKLSMVTTLDPANHFPRVLVQDPGEACVPLLHC